MEACSESRRHNGCCNLDWIGKARLNQPGLLNNILDQIVVVAVEDIC